MIRTLSKSRFKLALECPAKLNYTGKSDYANSTLDDEFLKALAEGGFQVGELAKLRFREGIEIVARAQQEQISSTLELLTKDSVTLFEATFLTGNFLARVDILRKEGKRVDLIEVKAKSWDSRIGADEFWTKKAPRRIKSDWLPYLQDVAFQTFLFHRAFPELEVHSFLLMPDKSKVTSVDGLNQYFRLIRDGQRSRCVTAANITNDMLGEDLLVVVPVDDCVSWILEQPIEAPGFVGGFDEISERWAHDYAANQLIKPTTGAHCADCEFREPLYSRGKLSGFHECWKQDRNWKDSDFSKPTVLNLFNYRSKQKMIDAGKVFLHSLTVEDIDPDSASDGLSTKQRQWMQCSGDWAGGGDFFIDKLRMREAMREWTYPLHFIDFETCQPALPFTAGRRPYERVAFQFSHHTMNRDGKIEHSNEFIDLTPGKDPSYNFLDALQDAIGDAGSVFMWSPYENTVLNSMLQRLRDDRSNGRAPRNVAALEEFILSITKPKTGDTSRKPGVRAMIDLARLAERNFFHPYTKGRSSIKVLLPAILQSSGWLKKQYSQPIYGAGGGIKSRNFSEAVWWIPDSETGLPQDPYKLLPGLFDDYPVEIIETLEEQGDGDIREGGAAATAYARIQFGDMELARSDALRKALLRYCELDTLAMVMVVEAWREWCSQ